MKKILLLLLSAFGSSQDFWQSRKGDEAIFWNHCTGSPLQAAKAWRSGPGTWYLFKYFIVRCLVPPITVISALLIIFLACLGVFSVATRVQTTETRNEESIKATEVTKKLVDEKEKNRG